MPKPITRVTLLIPGPHASIRAWNQALVKRGAEIQRRRLRTKSLKVAVDVEWITNESLADSFAYAGTVEQAVIDAIAAAPGALVLHWPVDSPGGASQYRQVKKLRAAGALAVRVEQSKLGWAIDDWIDMLGSPVPGAWHRGVIIMLNTKWMLQSCGMHAFSLPDVRVEAGDDPSAMHHLASMLDVYQLGERPAIVSGETFGLDAASPRRVLEVDCVDFGFDLGVPACNDRCDLSSL